MNDSGRVWAWVGIIVILVAFLVWLIWRPGAPSASSSKTAAASTTTPAWINVASSSLPSKMAPGIPLTKLGVTVLDRYYVDSFGITHGEYSYDLDISQHPAGIASIYQEQLPKSQWKLSTDSSSTIIGTNGNYNIQVSFNDPSTTTEYVDINYTYTPQ